jgi:hypothetical protein
MNYKSRNKRAKQVSEKRGWKRRTLSDVSVGYCPTLHTVSVGYCPTLHTEIEKRIMNRTKTKRQGKNLVLFLK